MADRHHRRKYAQGKNALAECMRSGQKMRYQDLVEDGQIPGLLVHPDWYEPRHPQEIPIDASDAVVLWKPSPELSVPVGEFDNVVDWEAWIIANCPAAPDVSRFDPITTLAGDAVVGSRDFALEDFSNWQSGWCVHIELDGGGWFVSVTSFGTYGTPLPELGTYTPFPEGSVASAGNQVYLNATGPRILNGYWTVDEPV